MRRREAEATGGDQAAVAVEFGILGPLRVTAHGTSVAVPGVRRRAILLRLLVEPNRPVSAPRLIDDVWSGNPPGAATSTLQSHMSLLRRDLGVARIVNTEAGYQIHVAEGELDAHVFEHKFEVGHAALKHGHLVEARTDLTAALGQWRGEAIADADGAAWAIAEAARLEEQRRTAEEELASVRLALGEHAVMIADLEAAVNLEPLRDQRWEHLMLALYRTGRQADALRAAEKLRRLLRDELGIDLSPGLAALEEAILLQKPELAWEPSLDSVSAGSTSTMPETGSFVPRRTLPPLLAELSGRPMLGRDEEQAALNSAWHKARCGSRRGYLITGEAGVGKTRLLAQLAEIANAEGALVILGRCDEAVSVPYQPLAEAVRTVLRLWPAEAAATTVGPHAAALLSLVPELLQLIGEPRPDAENRGLDQFQLFEAAAVFFRYLSARAPVLFVVEDLQWALPSTVLLIRHLLVSTEPMAILIAATMRTEEASNPALADAVSDLRHLPLMDHLALGGLSRSAILELVGLAGVTATQAAAPLAETLRLRTGGNAFFIEQLLQQGHPAAADPPPSVVDLVNRRVARLPIAAQQVLRVLSVVGTTVTPLLLNSVAAAGGDPEQVMTGVDASVRAGLLLAMGHGRFGFTHDLVRESLYAELGPAQRIRLHLQVAHALQSLPNVDDHLDELALHFAKAASSGQAAAAVRFAILAAERAMESSALDQAGQVVERAAAAVAGQLDASHEDLATIGIWLIRVRRAVGDFEGAREAALSAAGHARAADSPRLLGLIAINLLGGELGADATAAAFCEEALEHLSRAESEIRCQLLAFLAYHRALDEGRGSEVAPMTEEALDLARTSGDGVALGVALFARIWVLADTPAANERLRLATELIYLENPSASQNMRAGWGGPVGTRPGNQRRHGLRARAVAHLQLGDRSGFDADREQLDADPHFTAPEDRAYGALFAGTAAHLDGRLDEAETFALDIIARGPPDPVFRTGALILLWYLRREQNRSVELIDHIGRAVSELPQYPTLRVVHAVTLGDLGDIEKARQLINELCADGLALLPRDVTWISSLALLSEALGLVASQGVDSSDRVVAGQIYSLLTPFAHQAVVFPRGMLCPASTERYLAMLAGTMGHVDNAIRHYEDALDFESSMRAPTLRSRSMMWYGRFLCGCGGPGHLDRGHLLLEGASSIARDLGLRSIADQTESLLSKISRGGPTTHFERRSDSGDAQPPGTTDVDRLS